ncbi:hypothetical protein EX895_003109 [Sporisorium graminicola]|uniref:Uncharacterized protein n=1 Tax=Sporisorium graminicola TaxID=280036 RepID=A0A4U7KU30_9BASI|nr:hypothetical protein EX895_003109 [Sporisorium graminicola]TKY88013.1 hypothetical protein EX895_003109 [Sporisorium graminicola]
MTAAAASAPASWEGDHMLHIYVCDYLRKRGYSQAALALRLEAGLEPDRKAPIDAPQSLLFEWWVVFWEIFASRSLDPSAAADGGGLSVDAQTYALYRPPGLPEARSVSSQPMPWYPIGAHQIGPPSNTMAQQPTLSRRMSQAAPALNDRSEASSSARAEPQQSFQQRRLSASTLPQLDLEASHKLGLTRPASRVVIQQCMDMMNLGVKEIEHLTIEEKRALAKRVTRLQAAQNDAQLRLARLHGLQPPKPLLPLVSGTMAVQARIQQEAASTPADVYNNQVGQKRKDSPNSDADQSRISVVAGPSGPVQDYRQIQAQLGPAQPSMRRPSYSALAAIPSATPSPLTPSNAVGLPFSQVSPHPMLQYSPASSAPTPSAYAMIPPLRRPSVFGPESAALTTSSSPHKTGVYATSGLMGSSVSPGGEWHGLDVTGGQQQQQQLLLQAMPPLLQPQRPVVMPSGLDPPSAQFHFSSRHPAPSSSGLPPSAANSRPPQQAGGQKEVAPAAALFQLDLPPPHLAKPSVLASAATAGSGDVAAGWNEFMMQQHGEGSAPPTPFSDLEYDFNVLLSNSTLLSRAGESTSARQTGGVGGT